MGFSPTKQLLKTGTRAQTRQGTYASQLDEVLTVTQWISQLFWIFSTVVFLIEAWNHLRCWGSFESKVDGSNIQAVYSSFFFPDSEAFLHSLHAHLSWDQYQCDLGCLRCDICDLWFIYGAFKHGDFLSLFVWKIYIDLPFWQISKGLKPPARTLTCSYELVLVMTERS